MSSITYRLCIPTRTAVVSPEIKALAEALGEGYRRFEPPHAHQIVSSKRLVRARAKV